MISIPSDSTDNHHQVRQEQSTDNSSCNSVQDNPSNENPSSDHNTNSNRHDENGPDDRNSAYYSNDNISSRTSNFRLERQYKINLVVTLFYALIVIPVIVLASISSHLPCDSPLSLFLFVYSGLLIYAFLIERWVVFFIKSQHERQSNFNASSNYSWLFVPYLFTAQFGKIFFFIWYIIGNVWFWKADSCVLTNPIAYWTVMANLILSYLGLIIPVMLCIIAWVFLIMRRSSNHRHNAANAVATVGAAAIHHGFLSSDSWLLPITRGLNATEMAQLKTVYYKPSTPSLSNMGVVVPIATSAATDSNVGTDQVGDEKAVSEVNKEQQEDDGLTGVVLNPTTPDDCRVNANTATTTIATTSEINIILKKKEKSTDKTCAICFNDYVEGEALRLLQCQHQFHKACVDVWLKVGRDGFGGHRTCPVCVQDVLLTVPSK